MIKNTLFALCVLAVATTASAQSFTNNPVDPGVIKQLQGRWTNELSSVLTIDNVDAGSGAISGSYFYANLSWPLIGWVNDALPDATLTNHVVVVSFSVRWGKAGKVTAWDGYLKGNSIVGQWILASPNSTEIWDHILAGQDIFTR